MVTKRTEEKATPRVKKGDTVRVLLGKDRGKSASVLGVLPKRGLIVLDGLNMVFKHVRPRRAGEKGQRVQVAAPMNISNVQVVCPACKKGTRVGYRFDGTDKLRVCKQCDATIPTKKASN
ncbi:50S ribosomal protein L24 [bacterium]|nr:50S ribosomal protein L24 [bacterium]